VAPFRTVAAPAARRAPLGDALCRFNPIHGQGMSSAAMQARLLRDVLERQLTTPDPIPAVQARVMAEVADILQTPWTMSTTAELAFPATRGARPEDFEEGQAFDAALFRAAVVDPIVHRIMVNVMQLLLPIGVLRRPEMRRRIEAASAKRRRKWGLCTIPRRCSVGSEGA
jgi:hypothetical protein